MQIDGDARMTGADRAQPVRERVRWRALAELEGHLEMPMAFLSVVWLVLFVVDVLRGLNPLLTGISVAIWIIFIADFALRLLIAPRRLVYLRRNWLVALSLLLPALRVLRVAPGLRAIRAVRVAKAAPGMRLVRAVTSMNRGMRALGVAMRRRGMSYVLALTVAVAFAGAAGMYGLEPHAPAPGGFTGYFDALWWTAMILTTLGSAYWPQTPEGRILAVLISLYAIGVFGYITASLASFLLDRDAASQETEMPSASELRAIRRELEAIRGELRAGGVGKG
jgi:voltage-gated potassium channel